MAELARRLQRLISANDSESDADLLYRFVTERDGLAFAAAGEPTRADGARRLSAGAAPPPRRRGRVPGHVHGPGPAGRGGEGPGGSWGAGSTGSRTGRALGRQEDGTGPGALGRRKWRDGLRMLPPTTASRPSCGKRLDRELAALPEVYRAALVACELEGLSRREAAVRLGWTEGTLSSRLARARSLLGAAVVPVRSRGARGGTDRGCRTGSRCGRVDGTDSSIGNTGGGR